MAHWWGAAVVTIEETEEPSTEDAILRDGHHPEDVRRAGDGTIDRPGVTTAVEVTADPARVMDWLLHAPAFPRWVVGPGRVVAVDATWPAPGAGFTHETGRGPLRYRDRTVLREFDAAAGWVTLEAKTRPAGLALIQLHVRPADRRVGSRIVMHERPTGGPGARVPAPLYAPVLRLRNEIAMRRLRRLVERGPAPRATTV